MARTKPKKQICIYCNSHMTFNSDAICHFCRVKLKGIKGFKVKQQIEKKVIKNS